MEHCDGADPRHPCSCRSCHATIRWQMSAHLRYCRGMASQKTRYSCLVKRGGVLAWQGAFQLALDLETSPLARRHPALGKQEQMFRLGVWTDFLDALSIIRDEQNRVSVIVL